MHGQILPGRACNSCGFTMKMSSRYRRLLIYDVNQTTKIDGMGPFKIKIKMHTEDLLVFVNFVFYNQIAGTFLQLV